MTFWNWFFILLIFIPLLMLWIFALVDLFRRHDLHGWAKALWAILIVVLPLFGMLVYFIARPSEGELAPGTPQTAGHPATAEQLERLADLKDRGVLSEEEFEAEKAKLLS